MKNEIKINKLILCYIPIYNCNFRCEYCIVSQTDDWTGKETYFKYPVEHIIKALSKERLGGTCYINLTAQGETLLYEDIVPLISGLLDEGHFIEIVTNGLIKKRIDEILGLPESYRDRIFFKISYHYEQIKKKGVNSLFWDNVKCIKESKCSFTLELMPYDELDSYIEDIKEQCIKNLGAYCHLTVGRNDKDISKGLLTKKTREDYEKTWRVFDSDMFDLKMRLYGVKRREFCYAGAWSLLVDISNGEASQCYGRMNTQNIFKDLDKPIKCRPVGCSCRQPFCFNGHAHIAWGIIPNLDAPMYYTIRNRQCVDGTNWVKNDCSKLFVQKLRDNNNEYSLIEKCLNTITNPFFLFIKLFHDINGTKRKIRKFYRIVFHKY